MKNLFIILSALFFFLPLRAEINIVFDDSNMTAEVRSYSGANDIEDLIIPETVTFNGKTYSVTSIGSKAFYDCTGLKSIIIPKTIKRIGDYAFGGCKNLEKVEISDLTAWCKIDFQGYEANPTFYSNSLFLNGEEIIDLKIPDSINNIRSYSFTGLKHLKSVEIPNTIISIGTDAFDRCEELTNIDFPNSLKKISSYAFGQCKSLTCVTFPEFCSYLGAGAFSGCEGLKEINFNTEDFLDLSSGVFYGCKSIEKIFCNSDFPIFCDYSDVFSDVTYKNAVLYVLKKNINFYKNNSPWHLFQNLQALEDYPDVEGVDFILAEGQTVDVYSLNGLLVLRGASQSDLDALRPGIYIIGGKKYVVK